MKNMTLLALALYFIGSFYLIYNTFMYIMYIMTLESIEAFTLVQVLASIVDVLLYFLNFLVTIYGYQAIVQFDAQKLDLYYAVCLFCYVFNLTVALLSFNFPGLIIQGLLNGWYVFALKSLKDQVKDKKITAETVGVPAAAP